MTQRYRSASFDQMVKQRVVAVVVLYALIAAGMATVFAGAPNASAQDDEVVAACALYQAIVGAGGQRVATAATELLAIGAPNPPGITNALEIIIEAESDVPPSGSRPSADGLQNARETIDGYFGGICESVFADRCPLVLNSVAEAGSSDSAALLRRLEAPAPPGIDAALAVLAGEIRVEESPFHQTIDQAADQVRSYYATCFGVGVSPVSSDPALCSAARRTTSFGGILALSAVAELRILTSSNPAAVEAALDTIVDFEDGGSAPTNLERDQAIRLVDAYFVPACDGIDICALVNQAVATNDESSAEAARLLGGIEAPAPPGIGAALALIAGDIDTSPFHETVAEAQQQIQDYYPCAVVPPGTENPPNVDVVETCADLSVIGVAEGPLAVAAAERLRARGAPNPPGIEAALDVIVDAADNTGSQPTGAEVDAAFETLDGYFGGACSQINRCELVNRILGPVESASMDAARLLGRLETPAPPGIGAALALIAGEIAESPFHESLAQAKAQIRDYYPCSIAFTGTSTTVPLSLAGLTLIAAGGALLVTRRRMEQ